MTSKHLLIFLPLLLTCELLLGQQTTLEIQRCKFDYDKVSRELSGIGEYDTEEQLSNDSLSYLGSKIWTNVKDDIKDIHGEINLNYSYGLNTVFTDTTRGIAAILGSSGQMQSGVLGLPVLVSYNYSTLRMPLGANNFFRISFDKQRYIDNQKAKLDEKLSELIDVEGKLKNNKAKVSNMQGQTEVYLDMLKRKMEQEGRRLAQEHEEKIKDSLSNENISDSSKERSDSVLQKKNDTQKRIDNYKKEYDNIIIFYQKILSTQKKCDSLINKYENYKNELTSHKEKLNNPDFSSYGDETLDKMGFIKSIQKIDIGLTYSKTTALSDQNTAIKGIGTEFQYKNYYLAFSTGLTMNNVMLSTNEITNQLNYNQNVFNQFDFQKVKDNGVLTSVKTGWGKPEETHVLIGFNYLTNTRFLAGSNDMESMYDPAASVELDLRYVPLIYKGGVLDVVYGKTSANNSIDSLIEPDVFGTLFSNYRSNLLMLKYGQEVAKIRSNFSIQYRNIDPNANTTVYGMMQPGNKRIAFESRHRVLPYLNFGTTYKIDESNGTDRSMKLQTTGVNVSGRYTEYITYSTMFNYVHYSTEREAGDVFKGSSYLAGINLESNYKVKDKKALIGVNYNDYLFSDTANALKYTQFGVYKVIGDRRWSASLKYDYFFKTDESVTTGTHVYSIGGKYIFEAIKLDGSLIISADKNSNTSMGGHLEVEWKMTKNIDLTFRAERFVMGDFYRSYYRILYERLPYLFTMNTSFKF